LNRSLRAAVAALVVTASLFAMAPRAHASAEVHKFSLMLSGIPSSIAGGSFNDAIDHYNQVLLTPRGFESVDKIQFAWMFDAEMHYFVRSNVAVNLGVGQIHTQSKREFLPAIGEDIQIRAELLSVPIHAGADYYLTPFNQGDFQARVYMGAGLMSAVDNRALVEQVEVNTDSTTTLGGTFNHAVIRDAPGYYFEGGVHMFFASSISVMLGATYRSLVVRNMIDRDSHLPVLGADGKPYTLDLSGVGMRIGLGFGF
jgi:hypothetical protein